MDYIEILLERGLSIVGIIFLVIKGIPWILAREEKRALAHEARIKRQAEEHEKRLDGIIEKHEKRMVDLVQDYKEHTNLTNQRLEEINTRIPEIIDLGKTNERLQRTLEQAERKIKQSKQQ